MTVPRTPLFDFPDVVIQAEEAVVKRHLQYAAAKSGDPVAAGQLVAELANRSVVQYLRSALDDSVELVAIHALESTGVNQIPAALARLLSRQIKLAVNDSIVQANSVGHTGASGFHRLANHALFEGSVTDGRRYFLVDDFVGQGGTLANLIGFISSQGGQVIGATVLTGKTYSAKLAPDSQLIQTLRQKHGRALEEWWQQKFGFDFDRLTRSEARYLEKTTSADTIRDRIAAAGLAVGS